VFKIVGKKEISPKIYKMELAAPLISKAAKAGQFLVVRTHDKGERIPLTIADKDVANGTITIVFQTVGASTEILSRLNVGDGILDVLGPLGHPTEIQKFGTVVLVGGGVGVATIYPIIKAMKAAGNNVTTIIGSRCEEALIFKIENASVSDKLHVTTDDGSCGIKGFVTDQLKAMIAEGSAIDRVIAVGPVPMMKAVSNVTRPSKIKTIVSLNPLMLDATGMCGVCRVSINGEIKFACVDGPEFDGHQVDFDELANRLNMFKDEEKAAMLKCERCK
jgi:ferredoxin/flavodoxin---NADP+ reductase